MSFACLFQFSFSFVVAFGNPLTVYSFHVFNVFVINFFTFMLRDTLFRLPVDDLKEKKILEFERARTVSHFLENLLWKRLWSCCKADYAISEYLAFFLICVPSK